MLHQVVYVFFCLFVPLMISSLARADSYAWGGQVGRLQIAVTKMGFNEGAGIGGWSINDAKEFASWARRFSAALPDNIGVVIEQEEKDPLNVTINYCKPSDLKCERPTKSQTIEGEIKGSVDDEATFAKILELVQKKTGRKVHALPRFQAGHLYTIQVFSARSEGVSGEYARALNEQSILAPYQMYYSACRPCSVPEAKVIEGSLGGRPIYRVVVGLFEDIESAKRSLKELTKTQRVKGFVKKF